MAWPDTDAYSFESFREALGRDWYAGDALLRRWLGQSGLDASATALVERLGHAAATRHRDMADLAERGDRLPTLAATGLGSATADDVVLPAETLERLGEVHGSGLWRPTLDERARYAAVYLLAQNGEAGLMCSLACTDGLARALRQLGSDERSRRVLEELEGATPRSWVHGAQFVTEVQGGSDAATNRVRADAAPEGLYELHGRKWFCSNLTAEYWLVTARPPGAPEGPRGVALFCAPRTWDGRPNGHVVERLKDKLGTRALATAEIRFTGAKAWPLGPLDQGLRNMVSTVLTTSRIHNVLGCAAFVRRAARDARAYARFRTAFGRRLEEHPLVAESLRGLDAAADATEAGAFATVDAWIGSRGLPEDNPERVWARVLLSLAKAVTARRTPALVYQAMMTLGGNGIEERFTALPRLWRDAAIFETWEGPYSLLLMQALDDLARFRVAGTEEAFLRRALGRHALRDDSAELAYVLEDPSDPRRVERWGRLAPRLYGRFEAGALEALAVRPGPRVVAPWPGARPEPN